MKNKSSNFFDPMDNAKRQYPNRYKPLYPYNATGDCMPYIIECKDCKKLSWSLCSYDRVTGYLCRECYNSSKQKEMR